MLHCDLKAAHRNIQHSLIWELMLYEFKVNHNAAEATKNNCCMKDKSAVDHNTVRKWFKKFCIDCKNLNNQARLSRPKTIDSKAMLQAIEANLPSRTQRVAGELSISQSSVVIHLYKLSKSIHSCWIVLCITKIFQNFLFILVLIVNFLYSLMLDLQE